MPFSNVSGANDEVQPLQGSGKTVSWQHLVRHSFRLTLWLSLVLGGVATLRQLWHPPDE
jgi:hypothetical protein